MHERGPTENGFCASLLSLANEEDGSDAGSNQRSGINSFGWAKLEDERLDPHCMYETLV